MATKRKPKISAANLARNVTDFREGDTVPEGCIMLTDEDIHPLTEVESHKIWRGQRGKSAKGNKNETDWDQLLDAGKYHRPDINRCHLNDRRFPPKDEVVCDINLYVAVSFGREIATEEILRTFAAEGLRTAGIRGLMLFRAKYLDASPMPLVALLGSSDGRCPAYWLSNQTLGGVGVYLDPICPQPRTWKPTTHFLAIR